MAKRTVKFNPEGIKKIPNDKPVVYKVLTKNNNNNYTGVAKKGRVLDRLTEHLPKGKDFVPGVKVQIEQMSSIKEALSKENNILSRSNPKYNKKWN